MKLDVYKEAVLRLLPQVPEPPLAEPPVESFDLQNVMTCPSCGSNDAAVQQVEDAEIAVCPQCQCEFCPQQESESKRMVQRISEHRRKQSSRVARQLRL